MVKGNISITPRNLALSLWWSEEWSPSGPRWPGFPGGTTVKILSSVKETQETQVRFLGWEDPLEKKMAATPVFLSRESHGQRSLAGYSPLGLKESDMSEQLST